MRNSLLLKIFAAYLLPVSLMVAATLQFGQGVLQNEMDEEIGRRLSDFAAAAAAVQRVMFLKELAPGDDGNRTHLNAFKRIMAQKEAASDLVERIFIFKADRTLIVSTSDRDGIIGTPLPELGRDLAELEWSMANRRPIASKVTFEGYDGRIYKSGYAPLMTDEGDVWGFVGVDASAESFRALKRSFRHLALMVIGLSLLGLLGFAFIGDRLLLRPIRRLQRAAGRIQQGDLKCKITLDHRDELGRLAEDMDQMRERLLARDQEMQMMLSGIAHEVRNPLGGIALFAGLLSEELTGEGDQDKRECVEKIQRELGHLERLVDDFLGYAREPRLEKAPIDIPRLFRDLADVLGPRLQEKKQTLEVVISPAVTKSASEGRPLVADETTLHRALLNLLINAVQAAPENGRIVLEAAVHRDKTLLSIRDDGPGIPPEIRPRLLTPFFTTKEKGIGLGLSLVARFAAAHGGTLNLLPSDKGAYFQIALPTSGTPPAPPEEEAEKADKQAKKSESAAQQQDDGSILLKPPEMP